MSKFRIALISFFVLPLIGCATDPPGRAVVTTAVVAADIFGFGSLVPENCGLIKSPYDQDVCLRRNSEIDAARVQSGADSRPGKVEDFEAYKQRQDQ
jgi:hypothetical protein